MLMNFDPFREFDRLPRQVAGTLGRPTAAPMDAFRHGDRFTLQFDLPGAAPDSIDVDVERNVLTVRATRERSYTEGDEILVAERPHGEFTRQIFLSDSLDTDSISAGYDNGVLTLTLTVAQHAKPRRIEIARSGQPRELMTSS